MGRWCELDLMVSQVVTSSSPYLGPAKWFHKTDFYEQIELN